MMYVDKDMFEGILRAPAVVARPLGADDQPGRQRRGALPTPPCTTD